MDESELERRIQGGMQADRRRLDFIDRSVLTGGGGGVLLRCISENSKCFHFISSICLLLLNILRVKLSSLKRL